jgi:hypothetical protein
MRGFCLLLVLILGTMVPAFASAQCANGRCSLGQGSTGATVSYSQGYSSASFSLAPGEVLVAVNGVPAQQYHQARRPVASAVAAVVRPVVNAARTVGDAFIVNRDERAYRHALREAQILADRRGSGHPLGVAPGCRYSGTGTSLSPNRPNHCYSGMPNSRLVARAMVVGSDGRYYWSAHYR